MLELTWETFKLKLDNINNLYILLAPFRAIALGLRNLGSFHGSSEIYKWIFELQKSVLGPNHTDAIAASFHLVEVHRLSKDLISQEAVLQSAFESAFHMDPKGPGTFRACSNLVLFTRIEIIGKMQRIYGDALVQVMWSSITSENVDQVDPMNGNDIIHVGQSWAVCLCRTQDAGITREVYQSLHELCILRDASAKVCSEVIRDYSSFLASRNDPECAVKLY